MQKLKYIAINYNDDTVYYRESLSDNPIKTKKIADKLIKQFIKRDIQTITPENKRNQMALLEHNVYSYRIIAVTENDIKQHIH